MTGKRLVCKRLRLGVWDPLITRRRRRRCGCWSRGCLQICCRESIFFVAAGRRRVGLVQLRRGGVSGGWRLLALGGGGRRIDRNLGHREDIADNLDTSQQRCIAEYPNGVLRTWSSRSIRGSTMPAHFSLERDVSIQSTPYSYQPSIQHTSPSCHPWRLFLGLLHLPLAQS